MNIIVLNGSPKGERSNTYRITDAFLNGMKDELGETAVIETVDVSASHIEPCRGCFGCWTATSGACVIRDDMDKLLPKHPRRPHRLSGFWPRLPRDKRMFICTFCESKLSIMIQPITGELKLIVLKCSQDVLKCSYYRVR